MVKFRNRLTGSIMRVTDDRVEEYKKLGHTMVEEPNSEKPARKPTRATAENMESRPRRRK